MKQQPSADPNQILLDAVDKVGPRVYQLNTKNASDKFTFFTIGCHGSPGAAQKQVADLMKNSRTRPDLIITLGDNIYENGAASPNSKEFDDYFYNVYDDAIPHALVIGNHDEDRHKKSRLKSQLMRVSPNIGAGKNQVAHTYAKTWKSKLSQTDAYPAPSQGSLSPHEFSAETTMITTEHKINRFSKETLELEELDKWNMPYYFYSFIIGDVQIFFLNSNRYAKDFLDFHKNPEKFAGEARKNNQAAWLSHEYQRAKEEKRKIILAQHHPLYTAGKRISYPDTIDYITNEENEELNKILKFKTKLYHELLRFIFEIQGINFDLILAAHDHCLQYYNEMPSDKAYPVCQITSGGGGSPLQKRVHLFGHENVGCYLKENGYAVISFDKKNPADFQIEIISTKQHHLKFSSLHHQAICPEIKDTNSKIIRQTILESVDEYFSLVMASQSMTDHQLKKESSTITDFLNRTTSTLTSTISSVTNYFMSYENYLREDIDEIHNIAAYLNHIELPDTATVINGVCEIISKLQNKSVSEPKNPFYALYTKIKPFTDKNIHFIELKKSELSKLTEEIKPHFHQFNIKNSEQMISKLIAFGFFLTNSQHPFSTLIDMNLSRKLEKVISLQEIQAAYRLDLLTMQLSDLSLNKIR